MPKEIKLVPIELYDITSTQAKQAKHVQIFNTSLDNTEYEKAKILYMGEFVCVYTSDSCKERSAPISSLIFKETEEFAAFNKLKNDLEIRNHYIDDDVLKCIIDIGYRQIVQKE